MENEKIVAEGNLQPAENEISLPAENEVYWGRTKESAIIPRSETRTQALTSTPQSETEKLQSHLTQRSRLAQESAQPFTPVRSLS